MRSQQPQSMMPLSVQTQIRRHTDKAWGGFVEIQGTPSMPVIGMSRHLLTDGVRYFGVVRYPYPRSPPVLPSQQAYQLFYRSSGENTTVSGTWFPTDGFLAYGPEEPGGSSGTNFAKLTLTRFSKKMLRWEQDTGLHGLVTDLGAILYGKTPVAARPRLVLNELLRRFGSPRLLLVSYILGGGIWETFPKIIPLLGHYLKDSDLSIARQRSSQIPILGPSPFTVSPLRDATTLNRFSRIALSTNFLKQEYSSQAINGWVDYHRWYRGHLEVGGRSPSEQRMKTLLKDRYRPPSIEPFILYQNQIYIPNDLIHINLDTTSPTIPIGLKTRVLKGWQRTTTPSTPTKKRPATAGLPPPSDPKTRRRSPRDSSDTL